MQWCLVRRIFIGAAQQQQPLLVKPYMITVIAQVLDHDAVLCLGYTAEFSEILSSVF